MFEVNNRVNNAHDGEIWCVSWSKNRIFSGSVDGTLKLWEYDLKPLRQWKASSLAIISVTTNGHIGVSNSMDGHLKVWDFESGELKKDIDVGCVNAWSIRLHPTNPNLVAVSGHQGCINTYDLTTGSIVQTYKTTHSAFTNCVAFSSDGKMVAYANKDGVVSIFEADSAKAIRSIEAHMATIRTLAFSPDGQTLYTGSDDNQVGVFDVTKGEKLEAFSGHSSWVLGVAVSPTGNYVVSGGADKKVKVWSIADRECAATLQHHTGQVWGVAWNDLGTAFVTGGDDKNLILFKSIS